MLITVSMMSCWSRIQYWLNNHITPAFILKKLIFCRIILFSQSINYFCRMIELRLKCLPALLLVVTMIFSACSEPDAIGIDVQPKGDQPGVFYTDTISIEASTIREDTLRSDEGVAAFNLVGSYTDPVFGLSNASFYSQIRLPNNNTNFTFGTTPFLDSVVLT